MGILTDLAVKEIEIHLDFILESIASYPEDIPKNINFTQFEELSEDCTLEWNSRLARSQLERLAIYSQKNEVEFASRFHTILLARKNLRPYEFRDFMYVPSNKPRAQEVLGNALSELILDIENFPEDFRKKEMYLHVTQKLAPINFPVSQGYMDFFNLQHKTKKALVGGWIYQMVDTSGKGRYRIIKERK